jgi:hypothetical protein
VTEDRPLKPVPPPERCPFTRKVGESQMICTKAPHREEYGHNMVSVKEVEKYGW